MRYFGSHAAQFMELRHELSTSSSVIPAKATGIQWSPKSAYFWFNDFLDTGLRRHDGYKVNGTAVMSFLETRHS